MLWGVCVIVEWGDGFHKMVCIKMSSGGSDKQQSQEKMVIY